MYCVQSSTLKQLNNVINNDFVTFCLGNIHLTHFVSFCDPQCAQTHLSLILHTLFLNFIIRAIIIIIIFIIQHSMKAVSCHTSAVTHTFCEIKCFSLRLVTHWARLTFQPKRKYSYSKRTHVSRLQFDFLYL